MVYGQFRTRAKFLGTPFIMNELQEKCIRILNFRFVCRS